jgi:hypothetical protein
MPGTSPKQPLTSRYPHSVAEPRRILIDWDYGASGLWWCSTKEEHEAPYERWGYLTSVQQPDGPPIHMPELTTELRVDLKTWNDSWDERDPLFDEKVTRLQERGRQLAVRVQEELRTDDWEVFYKLDGRVRRVQPPGSWPVRTWLEELLGYSPRRQKLAEEEAPHKSAQHGGGDWVTS